ncbi:5'-methylthioadenosine/S-adenosylhomocysteine nucleosidase [Fictibacillus macauensis ZFHKF-1]|uniref:adenosylhomocysteine nucleosidase n=1 Tax=Fictibacillus macauensis ZFHKF-1 TaxID=1196324 RepID=I8AJ32_9BACL|nr:5'-methylthioadenosine/adenosylhomocysteine nucleosidase [Fictibacillus macauensis]EIT85484.1 5'-methylthioadenosine/S-adenosylhomocysteine nucleosidase [Fictibacillus macauensis ZFHKF-1]
MRIGIIGAMDEEIHSMKHVFDFYGQCLYAQTTFYEGTYFDQEVVLCKSGVGKVNAAIAAQLLVDRFQVTHIIFTGVAGAVDPSLDIGDIVISTSAIQHDMDASKLSAQYPQGTIPMFDHPSDFIANEHLIQLADDAAQSLGDVAVVRGRILSGDQFIADGELVATYHEQFQGSCIEMEGAAVAQVCYLNEIPFVIVRSISDKANSEATVNFTEFTKLAAQRSSHIVEEMIKKL